DGRPRVADFGIARSVDEHETTGEILGIVGDPTGDLEGSTKLTRTGSLMGTPAYMAPEQFSGAAVDARADQFAFCVVLHEALYGARPFAGDTMHVLMVNVCEGRLRSAPTGVEVPQWLRRVVLRGLSPEPDQRWPDMTALLSALEIRSGRARRMQRRLALLSTTLAVLSGTVAVAREPAAAPLCSPADAVAAMGEAWSPARRSAVDTRVDAAEHAEILLPRLDDWSQRWRTGWVDACAATRIRGDQSEELLDRRMSCLERRRRRFDAYTRLLADADQTLIGKAIDGLDALDDPDACADRDALLSMVALPEDRAQRRMVEGLSGELDEIHAALVAGEWTRARAALETAGPRVQQADWRPLRAELAFLQGRLASGTSDLPAADASYRQARLDALAVGDERLAAEALRDLATTIAEWESRHDEALEHLQVAEALAEHLEDPSLLGSIILARATVLELKGDMPAALAAASRGRSLIETDAREDPRALAGARHREAMLLYRLGRIPEARSTLADAAAGWDERYGPNHPLSLKLLNAEALLAGADGDWARARELFAEAVTRREASLGPDHLEVSDALANLAIAETNVDDLQAARRTSERALKIREREMGADNLYVGHSLANLAIIYGQLGEHELARAAAERAQTIIVAARGPQHLDTMVVHGLQGEILQAAGDFSQAEAHFSQALSIAETLGTPSQVLEYHAQIGLCRAHLGHFRDAAASLAAAEDLVQAQAPVPLLELLLVHLRARIAVAESDPQASERVADLRRQLAAVEAEGVWSVRDAQAWLDQL
ncbi:MAG: tetratricopeptide repeat protein, partial [Myxococcales bacterium]|nr:tetratricopeptide repeat protein [Myxococcales bacterium]